MLFIGLTPGTGMLLSKIKDADAGFKKNLIIDINNNK